MDVAARKALAAVVVDTSALVAIILGEDDAEAYLATLRSVPDEIVISAVNAVETAIVVEARQGEQARADLAVLLNALSVQVIAVEPSDVDEVTAAWRRFGKGRHPAQLNFGDCFAYALARGRNEALLFKGNDFSQTDVISAF